ncbi:hypothetical protein [Actinomadura sp. KC06]|uniref:hypothetical protein n=1 Tax=Actinomadura sp. KC06 TaxID=2530369 RepID=UPI001404B3E0|nr:hypothetical protein [Actinomadura sp. KC06]
MMRLVQGLAGVAVAVAGAVGGMASGLVATAAGFPLLTLCGAILSLVMVPVVAAAVRRC